VGGCGERKLCAGLLEVIKRKKGPHTYTHTTEGNKINKELGEWERKREKKGYYYRTTAGRT
jgi:hypothetical protein